MHLASLKLYLGAWYHMVASIEEEMGVEISMLDLDFNKNTIQHFRKTYLQPVDPDWPNGNVKMVNVNIQTKQRYSNVCGI